MTKLYNAPFPPEVSTVIMLGSQEEADLVKEKFNGVPNIETTCPPEDWKWERVFYAEFARIESVIFIIEHVDEQFLNFAEPIARGLYGTIGPARIIKIVNWPATKSFEEASLDDFIRRVQSTLPYKPPKEKEEVSQNDDSDGENDDDSDYAGTSKLSHLKRKKIQKIKNYRQWRKRENKKPYTDIGSWVKAATDSGQLSINELGVVLIYRQFLNSPYALECWPGEKAILKATSSAKTTWLRNRDSLEKKGWIKIEKFGTGTSPIVYPLIPGHNCPSKFAPKEPKPDENDTG